MSGEAVSNGYVVKVPAASVTPYVAVFASGGISGKTTQGPGGLSNAPINNDLDGGLFVMGGVWNNIDLATWYPNTWARGLEIDGTMKGSNFARLRYRRNALDG